MLDVKMVRANPDEVRRALQRRGDPTSSLDEFLAVEERRRQLLTEVESRRAERKRASDEIAAVKKAGGDADAGDRRHARPRRPDQGARGGARRDEERLNVMLLETPQHPARRTCPTAARRTPSSLRTRRRAPRVRLRAQGPPRPGPRPRPHRHGARAPR